MRGEGGGNDGLWTRRKTKSRFPLRAHEPLEIADDAIPTFPPPRRRSRWKSGNPKAGFPLSHRPGVYIRKFKTKTKKGGLAADRFAPSFRLTLRENQKRCPGSSFDENMLSHPTVGSVT